MQSVVRTSYLFSAVTCALAILAGGNSARSEDDRSMKLGKLVLTAPEKWESKEPRFRQITMYEFHTAPAEGDDTGGRMTVSASGGTVEANVQRWIEQFTQPDGGKTKDKAKVEKVTLAGHTVHLIDIAGTFRDQRGPMAPAVEREKYRMLGAIVETKEANYYVKFYGPVKTMAEQEKAFRKMIDGLK